MMKPVYILSSCAISPQHSFDTSDFLHPIHSVTDSKLFVIDPDYRAFINPVAIRRMSRQIKMGISTGMKALQLANISSPDAIITGTGHGSMTDMEHFLKDMINFEEQTLNPTYFIQSTYNSVNGWIALQSKCTGYNQTYVNRGLSLELSLMDAQLLLNETDEQKVALVGCFDELTDEYFIVKSKCHYWKKDIPDSLELLQYSDTPGTIAGEGTAFFTLSNKSENAVCSLKTIKMIHHPEQEKIADQINELLSANNLSAADIDVIITGMSGDTNFQPLYEETLNNFTTNTNIAIFKHLIGEYPTTSGFAVWLATQLFTTQQIPETILYKKGENRSIKNILIVNHYIQDTASLILLSA